jgi:hypothetical protein
MVEAVLETLLSHNHYRILQIQRSPPVNRSTQPNLVRVNLPRRRTRKHWREEGQYFASLANLRLMVFG